MRFGHRSMHNPEEERRTRRERAARLVARYIRHAPAPYMAPMTTVETILSWLVIGAIFLGLFLLLAWLSSAPAIGPH